MDVKISEQDGRLDIALIGDLDNTTAPEAEQMLSQVFVQNENDILLDCSQLNYISSMGLRLLITLYKHCRNNGRKALIRKMNENVREVLYIGGFLNLYKEIE